GRHPAGQVPAEEGRPGRHDGGPHHLSGCYREGGDGHRAGRTGQGGGRHDQYQQRPGRHVLRAQLPQMALRAGLLQLLPLSVPGGRVDVAWLSIQRDAHQQFSVHKPLRPGERDRQSVGAERDPARDAAVRLQRGRLHHPGIHGRAGRVQRQDKGVYGRKGRPATIQLRLRAFRVRRVSPRGPGPGDDASPGPGLAGVRGRSAHRPGAAYRSNRFFMEMVVLIIPVPYMRSATRCTWPTLRNVGYCPIVTRDAACEDISGSVRSTDWTVPRWPALAFASSSAARKPRKAAVWALAKLAVVKYPDSGRPAVTPLQASSSSMAPSSVSACSM